MIPRTSVPLDASLPSNHAGWIPSEEDLDDEEGFGFFRGVWTIRDVSIGAARDMIAVETTLVDLAGRITDDPDDFDDLARLLEYGDEDELRQHLEGPAFAEIEEHFGFGSPLDGLELGVAGLVYAL